MNKINNIYGIEMYYEIDNYVPRLVIADSNFNYFNDLLLEEPLEEDTQEIVKMLENTTLEEMIYFFGVTLYNSLEELQYDLQDPEITENNDYVNIFKVNDKKYYVWSE